MSDPGDEGNQAQIERDKEMILAAMMEELGVCRKDALPLDDRGPNIPSGMVRKMAARPIDPSDPIASHWINATFDDIHEADKLLDPIADGQLYRQRQRTLNAQSGAHSGNCGNVSGGRGGSNKSNRGGHHGAGHGEYHGWGGGYKGGPGKGFGGSTPGSSSRASTDTGIRGRKNARLIECVDRLRDQPSQGGYASRWKHTQIASPHQQSNKCRGRELPKTTFALASQEKFFAAVAKHLPDQQNPTLSSGSISNTASAPTRDTTAQGPDVQVSKPPAKGNLPAQAIDNPSTSSLNGGLAASRWAVPDYTPRSTTSHKALNPKSPVKEGSTLVTTLPKGGGLAASRWAVPDYTPRSTTSHKALASKSPVKKGSTPVTTLPKGGGLAASRWAPSEEQIAHDVQSKTRVDNSSAPTTAPSKEGLAASTWAPAKKGAQSTSKNPPQSTSVVKGTPVTKPTVGLQGSSGIIASYLDAHSPKASEDSKSRAVVETNTTKLGTKRESVPRPLLVQEHSGVEVQKDNGLVGYGNIRLTGADRCRRSSAPNEDATPAQLPPTVRPEGSCRTSSSALRSLNDPGLEGGKKPIAPGEASQDKGHQDYEQHRKVPRTGPSALCDLSTLNDDFLVKAIFTAMDQRYGPFLTQLNKAVGQQSLGPDAPLDELLASEPHIQASHELVTRFLTLSQTFRSMTKPEMAPYIQDLTYKIFAMALVIRDKAASSISQMSGSDPAVIASDSQTIDTIKRARHVYPVSELLRFRGEAIGVNWELLPRKEMRRVERSDPKNIIRHTASGVAIVAGRDESQEDSRSVPQFKPATSAAGWQTYAHNEEKVGTAIKPRGKMESGNAQSKQTTPFSYENSAAAFDLDDQGTSEKTEPTSSYPFPTSKATATFKNLQARSSKAGDIPEKPSHEPSAKDSTSTYSGNDLATASSIGQPNTYSSHEGTKPAKPMPVTPGRKPQTGSRGLNINAESGPYATNSTGNGSANVPSHTSASALPTSISAGATTSIEHCTQLPSHDKQQTSPHGLGPEPARPLNAMAPEYKSSRANKPTLLGPLKDLLNLKGELTASIWAPKSAETTLNHAEDRPLPTPQATMTPMNQRETFQPVTRTPPVQNTGLVPQSTNTPGALPSHISGAVVHPTYPATNHSLPTALPQPTHTPSALSFHGHGVVIPPPPVEQPRRSWRFLDPQTGNMVEVVGEIVGVASPIQLAPISMLSTAGNSFGGQENATFSSAATMSTDMVKPSPVASSPGPTPSVFGDRQNVPAPNLRTFTTPAFTFPPRANMHSRHISNTSSDVDAAVFSASNLSNPRSFTHGRGRPETPTTGPMPSPPLRHENGDRQAELQTRLNESVANRSPSRGG